MRVINHNKPLTPPLRRLFNEMRRAEMLLDDMDYIEQSDRYKAAMSAAKAFHDAIARHEGLTP